MQSLITGLPGASKTLNAIAILCSKEYDNRPKYYYNIKRFYLDLDVCFSFQGFFYGYYYKSHPELKKDVDKIEKSNRFVTSDDFPQLVQEHEHYKESNNPFDLFFHYVKKCYSVKQYRELKTYFDENESYDVDDVKSFRLHWTYINDPTLWYELPSHSLIVFDEAQEVFDIRPNGSKAPMHVSELARHRHSGYDIFLITQEPKLIDSFARKFVNNHIHFVNLFGSNNIRKIQANRLIDPNNYFDRKEATTTVKPRPKQFYGVYHSAFVHTHKFRLPTKVLFLPALVIVLLAILWNLFSSWIPTSDEQTNTPITSNDTQQTKPVTKEIRQDQTSQQTNFKLFGNHNNLDFYHSSLITKYTPLTFCTKLTYGGYHNEGDTVRYMFNCISDELVTVTTGEDEDSYSYYNRHTLDTVDLAMFGISFKFIRGYPVLFYQDKYFLFLRS